MSLLTGEYFEVDAENGFYSHCNGLPDYGLGAPPQKHAKRRFFQGNANWEEDVESAKRDEAQAQETPAQQEGSGQRRKRDEL